MWKPQAILPCAVLATYIQHRHKIVAGLWRVPICRECHNFRRFFSGLEPRQPTDHWRSVTDDLEIKRNAGRAAGIRGHTRRQRATPWVTRGTCAGVIPCVKFIWTLTFSGPDCRILSDRLRCGSAFFLPSVQRHVNIARLADCHRDAINGFLRSPPGAEVKTFKAVRPPGLARAGVHETFGCSACACQPRLTGICPGTDGDVERGATGVPQAVVDRHLVTANNRVA